MYVCFVFMLFERKVRIRGRKVGSRHTFLFCTIICMSDLSRALTFEL